MNSHMVFIVKISPSLVIICFKDPIFRRERPCRVGLVVSVYASHTVGRALASWPGHTKDNHKDGTNYLPALHAYVRVGV